MIKITQDNKILFLQALFISSLMLANIVGAKVYNLGSLTISVTIWLMPITFLITDILEEVKGKKIVNSLIWTTAIILFLSFLFIQWTVWLNPAERYTNNEAFVTIFQNSARFFLASIVAFLISQMHDVWSFNFWKEKTKGRFLWLRNNLSTAVSQFIDTSIFIFLAFYQIAPKFDFAFMWHLILPYYALKLILAVIDTPFVYLGVRWLKK
ncbi:queuosine precursor transporter [Candidatus Nomurabacteria bacterium]|nr:queuosine precursor transporter [Candidatus Nomurabacteria bacterium]